MFSKQDKKILIKLICDRQIEIIIDDHTQYESNEYMHLEELKVKIKDLEE